MSGPLRVNFKTHNGGSLRAEVLDASGKVIEEYGKDDCHELKGDHVDAVVTWKNHTKLPEKTKPLQVRFLLRNASLYSFAAGNNVKVLSFAGEDRIEVPSLASGVLYTFEMRDNKSKTVRNRFCMVETDGPGEQDGRLLGEVQVQDDNGAYGATSALNIEGGGTPQKPNGVEIPGTTNLGTTFTLSAMVKMANKTLARIFSSYSAVDSKVAAYEVLFDVDGSGNSEFQGLRAVINGTHITSRRGDVKINPNKYHHFAVTYDHGDVTLYFDGEKVGSGRVSLGSAVFSFYELRVGHDCFPPATESKQQLVGWVDDILVLPVALQSKEVKKLYDQGAERYFELKR